MSVFIIFDDISKPLHLCYDKHGRLLNFLLIFVFALSLVLFLEEQEEEEGNKRRKTNGKNNM